MINEENNWYVYRHRRLDNFKIFYIGIGKTKNYLRAYEKYKCDRNQHWFNIVNKHQYQVEIISENLSKEDAVDLEIFLISEYGRFDLNKGLLVNMTDGGDGQWGHKWSDERRKKYSLSKMGVLNHMFGKTQSKETIAKRVEKLKLIKMNPEKKHECFLRTVKSGQAKAVNVYKLNNGEFMGSWLSICDACRNLKIPKSYSKASLVANGKRKHTNGFVFKFITEDKILTT